MSVTVTVVSKTTIKLVPHCGTGQGKSMQNTSHLNSANEELVDALFDIPVDDKKSKEKDTAKRRLKTRRAIEDYMESKRLRESLNDFYLD